MKQTFTILISILFSLQCQAQELIINTDFPDLTWPFLYDIESDEDEVLYTSSEQGILYTKRDGVWSSLDLDDSGSHDARGISLDALGAVWVSTDGNGIFKVENDAVVEHYSMDNSSIAGNEFRDIQCIGNTVWVAGQGAGLVKLDGGSFSNFKESNSMIDSDFIQGLDALDDGTLVVATSFSLFLVDGSDNITQFNLRDMFGFDASPQDISVDHNQDVWIATRGGIFKHDNASNEIVDFRAEYGELKFGAVYNTPDNRLWASETFEGLHLFTAGNSHFFPGTLDGFPSQVFDFHYYQDSLKLVGNIGATVSTLDYESGTSTQYLNDPVITVFPNPTNTGINVQTVGNEVFTSILYDAQGKQVSQSFKDNYLDCTSLNSGIYLLQVKNSNGQKVHSQKIQIIQ